MGNELGISRPPDVDKALSSASYSLRRYVNDLEDRYLDLVEKERQYRQMDEERESYLRQIECLENRSDDENIRMSTKINTLNTSNAALQNHLQSIMNQNEDQAAKIYQLKADLEKSLTMQTVLRSQNESAIGKIQRLEIRIKEIENLQNLDSGTITGNTAQDQDADLSTELLNMQEQLFAMQLQNHELKTKINEITHENEELRIKQQDENNTVQKDHDTETMNSNADPSRDQILTGNDADSIIVKNVPKLPEDHQKIIISLGQAMDVNVTAKDIKRITVKKRKFYDRQNMQPDKLILIVEFRSQQLKVLFLANKGKLAKRPDTKDIEILDFVSEEVYNLYQYAKILKSHGYNIVYWRNNCVYVKKTRSTKSKPILVQSIGQVDVLKALK